MAHPQKKRPRKISEAVFRGKQSQYRFDVFPMAGEFPEAAAVFIITRRMVDRNRFAHHASVCIGETESVRSELKKHKRAKCVKYGSANTVCILRESEHDVRGAIIEDLTEAHSYGCIRGRFEAKQAPAPKAKAGRRVSTSQATVKADKKEPVKLRTASKPAAAKIKTEAAKHRRQKQETAAKRITKSRAAAKPRARKMAA
jgi:hypothetical protein